MLRKQLAFSNIEYFLLLACCWLLGSFHATAAKKLPAATPAPLFVMLLDGLRWDYPLDDGLTGFSRLRKQGASIIPLRPVYPSLCLPNIYSIFTGVYPLHHGLIGNENYDPLLNVTFNKSSPGLMSHLHTELGIEPLWDSLAKVGRRSLLYYLPGCGGTGSHNAGMDKTSTVCARPYRSLAPLEEVKSALLEGAESMRSGYADLVVLYVDLLDWSGHRYGPDSVTNRRLLLRQVDVLINLALSRIVNSDWGAHAGAHLAVMGDHGMSNIDRVDRTTLELFAMHNDVLKVVHVGAAVGVWPAPGKNQSLWNMMQLMQSKHPHVEVLTDAQIISRFYPRLVKAAKQPTVTSRLPPFSLLAEPGVFVETFDRLYPGYSSGPAKGWHGYDPAAKDMHTAAIIAGPLVHSGYDLFNNASLNFDAIEILDLYPLLLHLLGLDYRDWKIRQSMPKLINDRLLLLLLQEDKQSPKNIPEAAYLTMDAASAAPAADQPAAVLCLTLAGFASFYALFA